MVCFHTPISLLKLYVSVRGNYDQPTLNDLKYSGKRSRLCCLCVFSILVKQRLPCFGVRGDYTCLLTLSDLVIYSISRHS